MAGYRKLLDEKNALERRISGLSKGKYYPSKRTLRRKNPTPGTAPSTGAGNPYAAPSGGSGGGSNPYK